MAPSTWHVYQSGLRSFYNFCEKYKIHPLPAAAKLPASLIKTLGRWKSNAYESYVQFPSSSLLAVPSILAHADADTQPMFNPDDSTAA